MAWPCISRVCCLARFWSQLDKSDLSVPLTIHNYSDIEEQEDGAPQRGAAPPRGSARPPAPAPRPRDPAAAAGKAGGRRKGRAVAAGEPFAAETQYRRDFRAWPLPRRDAFPWVSASSGGGRDGAAPQPAPGRAACALPGGGGRPAADGCGGPEQLRPRSQADGGHTTSYRQEYRPWTGAKPSKPIKTKQGFIIPEDHFVQETSYKADFKTGCKGEGPRGTPQSPYPSSQGREREDWNPRHKHMPPRTPHSGPYPRGEDQVLPQPFCCFPGAITDPQCVNLDPPHTQAA